MQQQWAFTLRTLKAVVEDAEAGSVVGLAVDRRITVHSIVVGKYSYELNHLLLRDGVRFSFFFRLSFCKFPVRRARAKTSYVALASCPPSFSALSHQSNTYKP